MLRFCASLITLAAVSSSAAHAQTQPAPQRNDSDKVVCKREVPTGSIMSGKKVCRTKAQWQKFNATDQYNKERALGSNRPVTGQGN